MYTLLNEFEKQYFGSFNELFLQRHYCAHLSYLDFSIRTAKKNLPVTLLYFKNDWFHKFSIAVDLIAYDQPGKIYRFTVVYYLLSLTINSRLQIITQLDNLQHLETISFLYKSANWSEREIWDMFGIFFSLHPDLRRILTDYGFSGYPLRKDFPVTGYVELIYSFLVKSPFYKDVELTQEMRIFGYNTNWPENLPAPILLDCLVSDEEAL